MPTGGQTSENSHTIIMQLYILYSQSFHFYEVVTSMEYEDIFAI